MYLTGLCRIIDNLDDLDKSFAENIIVQINVVRAAYYSLPRSHAKVTLIRATFRPHLVKIDLMDYYGSFRSFALIFITLCKNEIL